LRGLQIRALANEVASKIGIQLNHQSVGRPRVFVMVKHARQISPDKQKVPKLQICPIIADHPVSSACSHQAELISGWKCHGVP
jgi:hypothetical protein